MRRVCFYHAGCPDGFGAAWSVRRAWGDGASYVQLSSQRGVKHIRVREGRVRVGHDVAVLQREGEGGGSGNRAGLVVDKSSRKDAAVER